MTSDERLRSCGTGCEDGTTVAPAVTFIVPVRNDDVRLAECLRSIQRNAPSASIEIIVVDNASTDRSAQVARDAGAEVLTIGTGRVAELRNVAAGRARGDILAFVDADHVISDNWVAAAGDTLRATSVAAVGALCHAPSSGTWVQRAYGAMRGVPRGRHDVEWLGSGNLAVRRTVFEAVGGFDTRLTTCEDVDLCNRIRQRGHRIVSNAAMTNIHFGDPDSLWSLFKGELWRGRDNLRVSLRGPLTWRALPSVLIPLVDTLMVVAALAGLIVFAAGEPAGLLVTMAAAGIVAAAAALRVVRAAPFGSVRQLPQVYAVAFVYDLARALALVTRAPHRNAAAVPRGASGR